MRAYIEMSRDEEHGGGSWSFLKCLWSPARKRNGGTWPFWEKLLQVKAGDIIFHLRGVTPAAHFVGHSIATTDGFVTQERPPLAKDWDYSDAFNRVDLGDFTPFPQPINLTQLFSARRPELEKYFSENQTRSASRKNIFYVRQSGRLQCLNGAYLSEADAELIDALFFSRNLSDQVDDPFLANVVRTGTQLAHIRTRVGQAQFSRNIKQLYGQRCCFPGCAVTDSRFLVGAHIARWTDNPQLRGHMGNGLCLCLMHDKAFELGLFTLDDQYRVYVTANKTVENSSIDLASYHGANIRLSQIPLLPEALAEHRQRTKITPT